MTAAASSSGFATADKEVAGWDATSYAGRSSRSSPSSPSASSSTPSWRSRRVIPLSGFANNPNVPPELRERIRKTMGLDDPIHVQYLRWASAYVQGDWLQSYSAKIPVRDYVLARLPTTLMISGSAFLLSILVAVPIGVISAIKQYSLFDQAATTFAFLGFSIPTFFSGILMILVLQRLSWLASRSSMTAR